MDAVMPLLIPCHATEVLTAALRAGPHEKPIAEGITKMGEAFSLYANGATGTYTLVIRPPGSRLSCILDAGHDLEAIHETR